MRITVVGSGYVGLVSGVCLAEKGHDVVCYDLRKDIVDLIQRGEPPIYECGLSDLLKANLAASRFRATTHFEDGLRGARLVLVAVGTPSTEGKIDLRQLEGAVTQVGAYLAQQSCFIGTVIKSTVIPGTTDTFVKSILEKQSKKSLGEFGLGMNPEFLREGEAVEDFMNPDRIVFGHEDGGTLALLEELYAPWCCEKLRMNTRTAEMLKYANNALLATQISAVNEIANLCFELGGMDVQEVMQGVHLDKRWSPLLADRRVRPGILNYLVPGCGFGGSCFPKDIQALRSLGEDRGIAMELLKAVLSVNDGQPLRVVRQLESTLGSLRGKKILLLGLAFKPGTDDLRESAAMRILYELLDRGAELSVHDPVALEKCQRELGSRSVCFLREWKKHVPASEAIIVATGWPEYLELAEPSVAEGYRGCVADARRLFQPNTFPNAKYFTIGLRR
jgi:UDPglucose 6-dehydrogenase/GDP-mannose 6-dehydrogenase